MDQDGSAARLLAQIDQAEARIARYAEWEKKARRYLFVKLPIVGVFLYGASRLDMLEVVIPLMLGIGLVVAVGDQAAAVLIVEGDLGVQIGDRVRHWRSSGS